MLKIAMFSCFLAIPFPGLMAADTVTKKFEGTYVWTANSGRPGDLRAEFTATDRENEWRVSFYFKFNGESHVYSGTASGELNNGSFSGKVFNENKRRSWTFEGKAEGGKLKATHEEIRDGGKRYTGTFEINEEG